MTLSCIWLLVILLFLSVPSYCAHRPRLDFCCCHFSSIYYLTFSTLAVFGTLSPSACIAPTPYHHHHHHHVPPASHPSSLLCLSPPPPSSPRSPGPRGRATRGQHAVPPAPLLPPQTPPHRTAGCQRQVCVRVSEKEKEFGVWERCWPIIIRPVKPFETNRDVQGLKIKLTYHVLFYSFEKWKYPLCAAVLLSTSSFPNTQWMINLSWYVVVISLVTTVDTLGPCFVHKWRSVCVKVWRFLAVLLPTY